MEVANAAPTAAATPTPGGFWERVVALILDYILFWTLMIPLGILFVFVALVIQTMFSSSYPSARIAEFVVAGIDFIIKLAFVFCYHGYFVSQKGATPGKLALGLRVVDTDTGELLPFAKAGLRGTIGSVIGVTTLGIGYLMIAFRADKKGLHDLIFRTQVWKQPK